MNAAGRRALIVDDEVGITTALRRALGREGYAVTTRNSPREALALLEVETFDVIISDQQMPGMTGTELMKIVRERYPDMLRLILTGTPELASAIDAINNGEVYRFVVKPWSNAELFATLSTGMKQLATRREQVRVGAVVERWNASF